MSEKKVAIVLQAGAGSHEGMARALHALLYTKELTEAGVETRLIFDGAGSEWAAKLLAPESPQEKGLAAMLGGISEQGVVYEICDYCSGAFHVKDKLVAASAPLSGQYMNHPSIAALVVDGFQVITL
ncbi:MAG: DsrE family protein [Dehalococcoidia bacterium]